MSIYKVEPDPLFTGPIFNGKNAILTQANSTAEAKALGKAYHSGDPDAIWAAATVTDVTTVPSFLGWTFNVHVNTTAHGAVNVTYTGLLADTVDTVGTALAALLLTAVGTAIAGTAHSAYNTSTNLLTVSSIADGIGDKTVTMTVTPAAGMFNSDYTYTQSDLVGSIVNGGITGAVLTIQLSTTYVIPGFVLGYRQ